MSLLEVKDLQAGYGKVEALFDGHIVVEPGELVGIVGPNGAGKSTFLRAIAGAVRPTAGTIEFNGQSIASKKPEDIVRLGLSLVPEGRAIFTDLTVEENLRLGLTGRRSRDGADRAIQEVTDLFPVLTTHRRRSRRSAPPPSAPPRRLRAARTTPAGARARTRPLLRRAPTLTPAPAPAPARSAPAPGPARGHDARARARQGRATPHRHAPTPHPPRRTTVARMTLRTARTARRASRDDAGAGAGGAVVAAAVAPAVPPLRARPRTATRPRAPRTKLPTALRESVRPASAPRRAAARTATSRRTTRSVAAVPRRPRRRRSPPRRTATTATVCPAAGPGWRPSRRAAAVARGPRAAVAVAAASVARPAMAA